MGKGQTEGTILVGEKGKGYSRTVFGGVVVEKRGNGYYVTEVIHSSDSRLSKGTQIGQRLFEGLRDHHNSRGAEISVYGNLENGLRSKGI